MAPWGFLLIFDVLQVEWIMCHLGCCGVRIEVIFLVIFLFMMIFLLLGPSSEVAQGPLMALFLRYTPSEVVSLM